MALLNRYPIDFIQEILKYKVVYSLQAPNFCWLMPLTDVHHIVMPKCALFFKNV